MLVALSCLITLLALLITEENWRGKREWQTYRREQEAKGERFDAASLIPPPVPDDENFFTAPNVVSVLNPTNKDKQTAFNIYRGDSANWPKHGGSWQKGTLTDLSQWPEYIRSLAGTTNALPVSPTPQSPAADILLALGQSDPAIEEIRLASRRPHARLPLNYEAGFQGVGEILPYLAGMKRLGQLLQLRALAELQNGLGQKSIEDVTLLLRVSDGDSAAPFLISHLVRVAMINIALQPVYEGLTQHKWDDAQLAELEPELLKLDLLADYKHAMRGELAFAIESFETQRITREFTTVVESNGTNKLETISFRFMPAAYFYQNQLAYARLHEKYVRPLFDLTNRIVAPSVLRQAEIKVKSEFNRFAPYTAQALMVYPAIAKGVMKFAATQNAVDLARTACALERFYLRHGSYPETLDALSPGFLPNVPHDVINGQPLKYRRNVDGSFVLYSVGWNEMDDGGVVALTNGGSADVRNGDWVWRYPVN